MECKEQMDTYYLGDALRALNYIPTNFLVEKLGGTQKKGEKYITIEEFLPIIVQLNNTKGRWSITITIILCQKVIKWPPIYITS